MVCAIASSSCFLASHNHPEPKKVPIIKVMMGIPTDVNFLSSRHRHEASVPVHHDHSTSLDQGRGRAWDHLHLPVGAQNVSQGLRWHISSLCSSPTLRSTGIQNHSSVAKINCPAFSPERYSYCQSFACDAVRDSSHSRASEVKILGRGFTPGLSSPLSQLLARPDKLLDRTSRGKGRTIDNGAFPIRTLIKVPDGTDAHVSQAIAQFLELVTVHDFFTSEVGTSCHDKRF